MSNLIDLVMKGPKIFVFFVDYQFVEFVLFNCILKWEFSKYQCEENDSKCKDIAFGSIVLFPSIVLTLMNLRCHVAFPCSFEFFEVKEFSFSLKVRGKAKITDLESYLPIL
jgi:hypothetical protein